MHSFRMSMMWYSIEGIGTSYEGKEKQKGETRVGFRQEYKGTLTKTSAL